MAGTSKTCNKTTGYLKKIIGNPVGELFHLKSSEVIIGRNRQSAEICIQDPNVSRSHCALKYNANGWCVEDLKSVNGTFIDGNKLKPEMPYYLKDGAGIYLGPPGDAPVAFIFLSNMPNEISREKNVNNCSPKNRGGATNIPFLISNKSNKCVKRPSDSEASTTNERFSQRKKIATSSSCTIPSSRFQNLLDELTDNGNLSDCSISSLESLKTRIQKRSSRRIKNKSKKNNVNAASSSSPHLRSSKNARFESKPSTSSNTDDIRNRKRNNATKATTSKEFALLNTIFDDSESSSDTINGENSQSLLNDSKIGFQHEPSSPQKKNNKNKRKSETNSIEKQLKKATEEVKKLKGDKLYLSHLVKDLQSEKFLKSRIQDEFQKILDDELLCNICTEVFLKAVTLGCSHTFCEYCISEWKKKQKKCPICREKITSETNILVLDSFITKATEHLDVETQNRRKELVVTREKVKVTKPKRKKCSRIEIHGSSSNEDEHIHPAVQIRFSLNNPSSIQVIQNGTVNYVSTANSDHSSENDGPVEGSDDSGGNGRCYSCGGLGHWANECPYA